MSDCDARGMMVVGKITSSYGIKGWVRIHSYTDPQENFLALGGWQVQHRGAMQSLVFDQGKRHGKGLVAHIEGVDDRDLAEAYRGLEVLAPEEALPQLGEGDYYWRDLQGLQVWCRQEEDGDLSAEKILLGRVDYLIETGANDVLVVKACEGSVDNRERLIPYLPGRTVSRVDIDEGVIDVDWFVEEE